MRGSRRADETAKSRAGRRVVGDVRVTCQIWSTLPTRVDTQHLLLSVPSSSNMLLTHTHFYYSDLKKRFVSKRFKLYGTKFVLWWTNRTANLKDSWKVPKDKILLYRVSHVYPTTPSTTINLKLFGTCCYANIKYSLTLLGVLHPNPKYRFGGGVLV